LRLELELLIKRRVLKTTKGTSSEVGFKDFLIHNREKGDRTRLDIGGITFALGFALVFVSGDWYRGVFGAIVA
jgi:hypothetical protein